ncbi:hypothetical protein [Xanthomonas phage Tabio]|nr:hypothetical protein [Xanthomonas phage Tabio]
MDDMGMGKIGALTMAVVSAGGAVGEVVTKTETAFLNVPLSMLYVAIAGTMIGVFLLPAKEAARISTDPGASLRRRLLYLLFTAGFLGAVVLAYSFIAAWSVQAGIALIKTLTRLVVDESLVLPVTGLVGVGIRPWLPGLLKAVERRADRVIGGDP